MRHVDGSVLLACGALVLCATAGATRPEHGKSFNGVRLARMARFYREVPAGRYRRDILWVNPEVQGVSRSMTGRMQIPRAAFKRMTSFRVAQPGDPPHDELTLFLPHVGRSTVGHDIWVKLKDRRAPLRATAYFKGTGNNPKPEGEYQERRHGLLDGPTAVADVVMSRSLQRVGAHVYLPLAIAGDASRRHAASPLERNVVFVRGPESALRAIDLRRAVSPQTETERYPIEELRVGLEQHRHTLSVKLRRRLDRRQYAEEVLSRLGETIGRMHALGVSMGTQLREDNVGLGQLMDLGKMGLGYVDRHHVSLEPLSGDLGRQGRRVAPRGRYDTGLAHWIVEAMTAVYPEVSRPALREVYRRAFYHGHDDVKAQGLRLTFPERDLRALTYSHLQALAWGYVVEGELRRDASTDEIVRFLRTKGHVDDALPAAFTGAPRGR